MVVGHRERHGVRIGLTQPCSGVEGHPVLLVLIPINWCDVVLKRNTITVVGGIVGRSKQLPTAVEHLVETRIHIRTTETNGIARQYHRRILQLSDNRCATLQLQVDVDNVELVGLLHATTFLIFVVGILIDYGDNLLLHHVVGIRLTRDIERRGLCRLLTLNDKVLLVVGNKCFVLVVSWRQECSRTDSSRSILLRVSLVTIIVLARCRYRSNFIHTAGIGIKDILVNHLTDTVWHT